MDNLSEKLKALGVRLGTSHIPTPPPSPINPVENALEAVLHGNDMPTPYGNTFVVEQIFPPEHRQGDVCVSIEVELATLKRWAHLSEMVDCNSDDFLFLDTETSGLAGGAGTFAFLIGLGFQRADGFHLVQLFMRDPDQEEALLAGLAHFMDGFKAIVTFNGKSFDVPLLNTRHTLNGFSSPFPHLDHVDLLPLARRLWRNRLPNRSLGNLEIEILHLGRTGEEVPGWMVPEIYQDYLSSGNPAPLEGVFYHNAMDIVSLAALFKYTARLLNNPFDSEEIDALDLMALAQLRENLQDWDQAIILYERSLDQGLPRQAYLQTLMRFASLYRHQGDLDKAIELWEKAAKEKHLDACVELAKIYEHHLKDVAAALTWCEFALQVVWSADLNPFEKRTWVLDFQKRVDRLLKKQARQQSGGV